MKLIKKFQYSGSISPVTEKDYLNYWRDNNVETDEALIQRLAEKYGPDHMQNWIAQRQYEKDNPYSVQTQTGEINPAPKKSMSTKFVDAVENTINSNTLPGGLARTLGAATLGAGALTNLPAVVGGYLGGKTVDALTGGFGKGVENLTGIDQRVADFFNPGYMVGGGLGKATQKLGSLAYKLNKVTKEMPEGFMGITKGRGNFIWDRRNVFQEPLGQGAEGKVYSDGNGHAYKINDNIWIRYRRQNNVPTFQDKVAEVNARQNTGLPFVFPTESRGYVFDIQSGRFSPVTRQQQLYSFNIAENRKVPSDYTRRVQDMIDMAAKKGLQLNDTHRGNIAILDDGNLSVIDPMFTPIGGSTEYTAGAKLPFEDGLHSSFTLPSKYQSYKYRLKSGLTDLKQNLGIKSKKPDETSWTLQSLPSLKLQSSPPLKPQSLSSESTLPPIQPFSPELTFHR